MKLIKKIAAIMFAFMMVFSLSTNVKAIEKGSIEINNAIKGQTYKIYKIMELESYNPTKVYILINQLHLNGKHSLQQIQ